MTRVITMAITMMVSPMFLVMMMMTMMVVKTTTMMMMMMMMIMVTVQCHQVLLLTITMIKQLL